MGFPPRTVPTQFLVTPDLFRGPAFSRQRKDGWTPEQVRDDWK